MKSWYEDKQSFYRALAATAARLALWLLGEAASLYEQVGLKQEAAQLRSLVAAAPTPPQIRLVGEPTVEETHRELSWEDAPTVDGWPQRPGLADRG